MKGNEITSLELIQDIYSRFNEVVYAKTVVNSLKKYSNEESEQQFYHISQDIYFEGVKEGLIIFSNYILEGRLKL